MTLRYLKSVHIIQIRLGALNDVYERRIPAAG